MRREAVRKGPEAEEQTRIRIPKRWPVSDQAEVACAPGEIALKVTAWPGTVKPGQGKESPGRCT